MFDYNHYNILTKNERSARVKKRMSITAGLLLFISMSITSFANEKLDDFSSDTTLTQIESENYAEKLVSENDDLLQETIANLKKDIQNIMIF